MKAILISLALVITIVSFAVASPKTRPPHAATAPAPAPSEWRLADGAHPALQVVIDSQHAYKMERAKPIRDRINRLDSELANVKGDTPEAKQARTELQQQINELYHEIELIDRPENFELPHSPVRNVGEAGVIGTISVVQVIDDSTAIVEVLFFLKQSEYDQHPQIYHEKCFDAWLSGFNTSGWTDDKQIEMRLSAFSPGTHKTAGNRTLLEIRPFTRDMFERLPATQPNPSPPLPAD